MIAGMDRYVQIARCFRDEALRADRQLEFTQVDLEMSFATPPLVFEVVEGALAACFKRDWRRRAAAVPPHVVRARDGDLRIGQARPALRAGDPGLRVRIFAASPFGIFREAIAHGGTVRGFVIPGAAKYSRREVDELVEQAKQLGAAGLVYARFTAEGVQVSAKPIGEDGARQALQAAGAGPADLLVLASGSPDAVVEDPRPAAAPGGEEGEPDSGRTSGS